MKACSIDGCERELGRHSARGYCSMHLQRIRTSGSPGEAAPRRQGKSGVCEVDGCERPDRAKGLCSMHYQRATKNGSAGEPSARIVRYEGCAVRGCERPHVGKGYCGMHLARVQRNGDPGSVESSVNPAGTGHISKHGYRVVRREGRAVHEHRVVMEEALGRRLWPDENVHHINGDRLDNRIENLELWSTSQPAGQRVEDKLAWAQEIIARYAAVMA